MRATVRDCLIMKVEVPSAGPQESRQRKFTLACAGIAFSGYRRLSLPRLWMVVGLPSVAS